MRLVLVIAVTAVAGCSCPGDLCMGTGATPPSVAFVTTGAPATTHVVLPVSCGARTPSSVQASVLGPDNMSFAHTAGDPGVEADGFGVDVTFTPDLPGPYHLSVRFDPNFGLAQMDVVAALDRRGAGSLVLPQPCTRGDFTPGGLALCTIGNALDVFDGTTKTQTITGLTARAKGTLWSLDDAGQVLRWVEDGGAFELTATLPLDAGVSAIIPAVDDALIITTAGEPRLWTDAGIVWTPAPAGTNTLWRKGSAYATLTMFSTLWCVVSLLDGGSTCSDVGSGLEVVGLDPDGIWANREPTVFAQVARFDDQVLESFVPAPGWDLRSNRTVVWDTGAFLFDTDGGTEGPYVVSAPTGQILLENFGPGAPSSVTSTCVTRTTASSATLIRR